MFRGAMWTVPRQEDRVARVALLTASAAMLGGSQHYLSTGHMNTGLFKAAARLGGGGCLFGVTKISCEWAAPDAPVAHSLIAGGAAICLPNMLFPARTALLQQIYSANTGRTPTVGTVLAYSAVSGSILLGGTDLLFQLGTA